jgi:hypothetical protein
MKLKPCPHCQGQPKTRKYFTGAGYSYTRVAWQTFCNNFRCSHAPGVRTSRAH